MAFFEDEYKPAFTYQGHPVYWTHVAIILTAFCFIFGGILAGSNFGWIFEYTCVSERTFPQVWRLLTYPFLDPAYYSGMGILWLAFTVFIIYSAGMGVEQHVGGKVYLQLYFFAVAIPGLVVAIFCQIFPGFLLLSGMLPLAFAIIVAYATIFPDGDVWGAGISRSFFVGILIVVNSVLLYVNRDWGQMIGLWTACFVGYFSMRFAGSGKGMDFIVDWIERREEARHQKQAQLKIVKKQVVEASLDSVLEKISQRGMASLTPSERAILQKASSELQKRDRR